MSERESAYFFAREFDYFPDALRGAFFGRML